MSVASLAGYLQGGGGGNVDQILAGDGIHITDEGFGTFTISNTGTLGIDAGAGIDVAEVDGVYTITNTGVGQAIAFVEGGGISIVQEPENTYTFTNTGGGGGGNVDGLVAGTGIGVENDGQNVFTISNGGVLSVIEGDGIGVAAVDGEITITNNGVLALTAGTGIGIAGTNNNKTISNSGVLALTAGDGITLTGGKDNITITNSGGGGGAISAVNGGDGITANTAGGTVTLANTGVLALTEGGGLTITGTNTNKTISNSGVLAVSGGAGCTITGTNDNKTIAFNGTSNTLALNNYAVAFRTNTTIGYFAGIDFSNQTSPAIDGSPYYTPQQLTITAPGVFLIQMGIVLNSSDPSITYIQMTPGVSQTVTNGYIGNSNSYPIQFYPNGNGNVLTGSGSAIVQINVDMTLRIQYLITGDLGATFNYSGFIGAVRVA